MPSRCDGMSHSFQASVAEFRSDGWEKGMLAVARLQHGPPGFHPIPMLQGPLTPSSSHHVLFFFFFFFFFRFGFAAAILRDYTRMLSVYKSQRKSKVPIWRQYRMPPSSHALIHVPRAGRCLCTANPLFLFLFLLRSCVRVRRVVRMGRS